MHVECLCLTDFPPRDFQRLRDADEFATRVRFSTCFLQLDSEGLRFGCRRCGRIWAWTLRDKPPHSWRPEGRDESVRDDGGIEIAEVRVRRRR
ncbi:MAG: hypothetical protein IT452_08370 [Planctomycetia bacterium]|nr:hypothetical protein [Planctomycetia bacterium]